MSLEQAIYKQWQRDSALSALLPPQRITTGPMLALAIPDGGVELPYATLVPAELKSRCRLTQRVRLDTHSVGLRVWSASLTELFQLKLLIGRCFEGGDFRTGDSEVLDMRLTAQSEMRQKDGTWLLESTYLTRIETKEKP